MEKVRSLHAIVLAAGSSRRMGQNKLLLPWPTAPNILTATLSALLPLLSQTLQSIHVVTGHEAEHLHPYLQDLPVEIIHNPDHIEGMLSSLQTALRKAPAQAEVAMILPADLPTLQTSTLLGLLEKLPSNKAMAPTFQGQRGHPVFLPRCFFAPMLSLPKGAQPRDLFQREASSLVLEPVTTPSILVDIDTPEAYQRALHQATSHENISEGFDLGYVHPHRKPL